MTVLLLLLAFVCFLVATFGLVVWRLNLIALGLALWVLAVLLGGAGLRLG